jgi:hypothetical protein
MSIRASHVSATLTSCTCVALEHRQFPHVRLRIVPDDVHVAIVTFHFEVPMVWGNPGIQHLIDDHRPFANVDDPRRFLASVTRVAFDSEHNAYIQARNQEIGRKGYSS